MKKMVILLLLVFVFSGEALALNLTESIKIAVGNNPRILAARKRVEVGEAKLGQARGSFFPSLSATASYGKQYARPYDTEVTVGGATQHFKIGVDARVETKAYQLELSQPVFAGGALLSGYGAAAKNLEIAKEKLRDAVLEIEFKVISAYFNILEAGEALGLANKSIEMAEEHLLSLQAKYEAGTATRADVLRGEVQLAEARVALTKAKAAYDIVKNAYNNVLGVSLDRPVELEEERFADLEKFPDYEYLLQVARQNRPDLKEIKLAENMAEDQVSIARAGLWPSIALVGSSSYNLTYYPTFNSEMSDWNVLASARWSLFDGFKNLNRIKEASASRQEIKFSRRGVEKTVALEVKNARSTLKTAEETLSATEKALELATENYRLASLSYEAGVATNIQVIDAQVALTQAENDYLKARYAEQRAKAGINKVTGKKVFSLTAN